MFGLQDVMVWMQFRCKW